MRSAILLFVFCILLPVVLFRPYVGIYLWSWFGYMSPHRLTWGFTYDFPFAQLIAIVTLAGVVFTRDRSSVPLNQLTILWILFVIWMNVTTVFALDHDAAITEWERTMKIQLFSFLTIVLINDKTKLKFLVWIIALSIGFFGLKGGLFSIASGAQYRVWGPPGSFIADNNSIGLAFVMILPLIWFLAQTARERWQKFLLTGLVVLTVISTLTTFSRGALLGLIAISLIWMRRQKNTWVALLALVVMAPMAYQFMPETWKDRMGTMKTYEQDSSAMGRIRAWRFASELVLQRPIGGGFGTFSEENYRRYSPGISAQIDAGDGRFQNAHSIYFSILGEHGFPGLGLFLAIGYLTLRKCKRVEQLSRASGDDWSVNLANSVRIGVIGFAVSGAFLNLAYFDLFYHLIAIAVILERIAIDTQKDLDDLASLPQATGPASN